MSEYIQRPKTFKRLVISINEIHDEDQRCRVWWEIGRSFEADVITWRDYELLYDLASKVKC